MLSSELLRNKLEGDIYMKKLLSISVALVVILAMSMTAFAAVPDTISSEDLSEIYGIPIPVMSSLSTTMRLKLGNGVNHNNVLASNDTYFKIISNENGADIIQKASYQEYLNNHEMRDTDENSWMRVHTTIIDKGTYAQVSAAYTWLTSPAFRMKDVIGLSITQGTFIDNSADGFYTYTTAQGSFSTDFTSGFDYQGHGIVRNVILAKPDYPVKSDFLFMRANIYKEGSSEGLNGAYGHQRASVSVNPAFNIDRNGVLSCVGINVGMTYDRFKGYTSTSW